MGTRFEEWSDLVRGALVWAGEADPCDTRRLVAVGDSAREELVVLVDAWEAVVGIGKEVTAQNLIDTAGHPMDGAGGDETLRAALDGKQQWVWPLPPVAEARATWAKNLGLVSVDWTEGDEWVALDLPPQ